MGGQDFFFQALIYLSAAVISVPIAKRLGLGSVLGYLIAGIIIGPYVLKLVGDEGSDIMHFAEFGVVMMLFLIGLELKPSLLWKMRRSIFGLGGLQVILTAFVIALIAFAFKMNTAQSITIGLIFALSSTAIVLQSLAEKGLLKNDAGQSSFSVLLFQDIAVIPILAILPLFANQVIKIAHPHEDLHSDTHATFVETLSGWQQVLLIISVVAFIIYGGRFLSKYLFRFIANTGLREIFTATTLLLVIAIAVAMEQVGLSPALGTFLAGVVLADNEYRHELETDIEPFKGLLLGLFFIAVGASINFTLLIDQPFAIVSLLTILIIVKLGILYMLGRIFGLRSGRELLFAFSLAQGGEFAFVLISFSNQNAILTEEVSGILLIIVALSMVLSPLLLILNEKIIQPFFSKVENKEADNIEENENQVIIAGFGRFGVVIGRFLKVNGITATILDNNPKNISLLRKFGFKVYYGDATRHDLLESAGIKNAKILVVAIDDPVKTNEMIDFVKRQHPHVEIFSRAINMKHAFELMDRQVTEFRREAYDSSIELAVSALCSLGYQKYQAHRAARTFKQHDKTIMQELYSLWGGDKKKYISEAKRFSEQLEKILLTEQEHSIHESDSAWDDTTLREEVRDIYAKMQEEGNKDN